MGKKINSKGGAVKELMNEVNLNYQELRKASRILRAIDHDLRQQIMALIEQNGHMNVTDIYKKLDIEQSVASQHLGILRDAGLVERRSKGKYKFYSVNKDQLSNVSTFIDGLVNHEAA